MIKIVGKIDLDGNKRNDVLGNLKPLFDGELSIDGPTNIQKDILYKTFKHDIILNPPLINNIPLKCNKNKSRHPDFRNMAEGFVHCVTRESKYKGKREFDPERAQKIHWIKPVIENASDPKIKYFECINDKGLNQLFYWYDEKDFIIVVRELSKHQMLITAFNVDSFEKSTYKKRYEDYCNRQKKTPLRK